jgi:hypothetical protein
MAPNALINYHYEREFLDKSKIKQTIFLPFVYSIFNAEKEDGKYLTNQLGKAGRKIS